MAKRKMREALSLFDTTLSSAEWAWRIFTILFIGGTGTVGGIIAKADPGVRDLGPIYWLAVGMVTALGAAVIIFLVKSANLKQSMADLNATLSTPRSAINPLSTSFQDVIISVENLRLPGAQLHERKHFQRCKFVGPAAIAILGGTYVRNGFAECGDIIALPEGAYVTGITVLRNCTVQDCEFIRVTVLVDQGTAAGFANTPGAVIKGVA